MEFNIREKATESSLSRDEELEKGDLVEKYRGDWDVGKIGCVIDIITNGTGNDLVKVIVDGKVKAWSKKLARKIK